MQQTHRNLILPNNSIEKSPSQENNSYVV